jgi:lipopolysaccharide export system permease protein
MFTKLDRYLIGKFLSAVAFSLLIFTMVSMAIDFSEKVQTFIEKPCTASEVLLQYYPGFAMYMAGLLLPMYTLIGVVFFTSRLAFNAEILSIFNAGVSFWRLARPYLIAAGLIATVHFTLNHFAIPVLNKIRLKFERTYIWLDHQRVKSSNVHFLLAPDVKLYADGFSAYSKTINGMRLERIRNNRLESIVEAQTATWIDSTHRWRLRDYTVRQFDGLKESFNKYSAPLDTSLNLVADDFIWYHNGNEEMTTPELRAAIERDRSRGASGSKVYEIERHRRTADAFTNIVLTMIGLALAGRKVRGGIGLHLALAIAVGASYVLLSKFAVSFASSGALPVGLGMWVPNIIFAMVALFLAFKAQK